MLCWMQNQLQVVTGVRVLLAVLLVIVLASVGFHARSGGGEGTALAAVRICEKHVTSRLIKDRSEKTAKRRALRDWTRKAKSGGVEHPSWRIANSKVLKCVSRGGFYECIAHGAPCTIKHKAPPSRKPRRPGSPPGDRNVDA